MATWIAHLRIAENILGKGYSFNPISFAVGNIGPDSGVPNEDWSNFDPPKKITHWEGNENRIDAQKFFDMYINNKKVLDTHDKYSFNMGYYIHLLTDIEWSKFYHRKKRDALYKDGLDNDKNFIWTIKKDWYGLDYLYLEKHPNCIFNNIFKGINIVPDYLDYFPKGAFTRQVKYISGFYLGENNQTKNDFIYLTEEEMDNFIQNSTAAIEVILRDTVKYNNDAFLEIS